MSCNYFLLHGHLNPRGNIFNVAKENRTTQAITLNSTGQFSRLCKKSDGCIVVNTKAVNSGFENVRFLEWLLTVVMQHELSNLITIRD